VNLDGDRRRDAAARRLRAHRVNIVDNASSWSADQLEALADAVDNIWNTQKQCETAGQEARR